MRRSTALALARPRATTVERRRFALIAVSVSGAAALLLAAIHVLRLPAGSASAFAQVGYGHDPGLARYVTESGLRPGVVIGTLLLAVPMLALVVQALRVGSVSRDRRMASLRLAGATPGEVRVIAALEAGAATLAGGLLAGAAYLVLWLFAGVLPPDGARLVDTPDAADALTWLALVPLAFVVGTLVGAAIHGRAVVKPLGVRRRSRTAPPGRASLTLLIAGLVLAAAPFAGVMRADTDTNRLVLIVLTMLGLLLAAFAGGSRFVLACARLLANRHGADALLASRRLRADPRSPGRVAAVLLVCGIALSLEGLIVAEQLHGDGLDDDVAFYLGGIGLAAVVALVAALVAVLTLLIGAADALLDARRPLATLAAVGVDEQTISRSLSRQLSATAVPAIAVGALFGAPLAVLLGFSFAAESPLRATAFALLPAVCASLVGGLAMIATSRLAARLLRPLIHAAVDPENLRAA
jgi:hypothetical protein